MHRTFYESDVTSSTALLREHHNSNTQDGTILLLAQHSAMELSLAQLLSEHSYRLHYADTLEQALQQLTEAEFAPQVIIINQQVIESSGHGGFARLREASAFPVRLIMLATNEEDWEDSGDEPDALLAWPWHEQDVLAHVRSQVRAQQTISELAESRAVLLGTSLLTMDMLGSLRTDLSTQTALHHELIQRVHTHIGALRDYLELEVRRLPLGIAREAMRGVLFRVRNLSALYDTMASLNLEDPVDFPKLCTRIGQGVKAMYSPRSKLPLGVEGQLTLPSASASPLALVVNELVTNAYRHAFPGGRFGKITITCGTQEQVGWCKVEDNGVGMAALPVLTSSRVTGSVLVQRLMRSALGGTCTWQNTGSGTLATVQFPMEAA